jgi:hypothetical protein
VSVAPALLPDNPSEPISFIQARIFVAGCNTTMDASNGDSYAFASLSKRAAHQHIDNNSFERKKPDHPMAAQ